MTGLSGLFIVAWPAVSSVLAAVVTLGLLIFAHELGHFIVAKLTGVGVTRFSLGFGRKLIGWKVGETEYMISAFPLGGYVKMVGEEDKDEVSEEDRKRSFLAQPVGKRVLIVLAGPVFNVLLAAGLCYILFVTGFPTAIAKVSEVIPAGPAQAAGFMPGDIVEQFDGKDADTWEQVAEYIGDHPGREIKFKVRRGRASLNVNATPALLNGKGSLGLTGTVVVGGVMVNSPADKAGLQANDRILAVDGRKVGAWDDMALAVKASPNRPMDFTVGRDGRVLSLRITPTLKEPEQPGGKAYGMIGVTMGTESESVRYGPIESIGLSFEKTYYMTGFTVAMLARIVSGKEKASGIGGPIAIVQISGRQARQGFADFVIFMALLSVNLGVINLFPIPILDGGHLFFFGLEAVMGKPLSMRKREIAQQAGLFLILLLMAFVFYNDFMRLLGFEPTWK